MNITNNQQISAELTEKETQRDYHRK
jgi:hypothetical protein